MHKSRFAGQFYPASKDEIEKELENYVNKNEKKTEVIGAIVPHAGWFYSGKCAGKVYSTLSGFDSVIILGTGHVSGINSISFEDFETPLGIIKNDKELGEKILDSCDNLKNNESSFMHEHSVEVQLPFLQAINKNFKIVPVIVAEHSGLAEGIVKIVKNSGKKVLILASSDFTHSGPGYGFVGEVEKLDRKAISKILKLDVKEFLFEASQTTICGKEPVALCLEICRKLGARKAELLEYYDSSNVREIRNFSEHPEVQKNKVQGLHEIVSSISKVGYAGIVIS